MRFMKWVGISNSLRRKREYSFTTSLHSRNAKHVNLTWTTLNIDNPSYDMIKCLIEDLTRVEILVRMIKKLVTTNTLVAFFFYL